MLANTHSENFCKETHSTLTVYGAESSRQGKGRSEAWDSHLTSRILYSEFLYKYRLLLWCIRKREYIKWIPVLPLNDRQAFSTLWSSLKALFFFHSKKMWSSWIPPHWCSFSPRPSSPSPCTTLVGPGFQHFSFRSVPSLPVSAQLQALPRASLVHFTDSATVFKHHLRHPTPCTEVCSVSCLCLWSPSLTWFFSI